MQNANTKESLDTKLHHIFNQLENLEAVPGIQIETGSILKVFFPREFHGAQTPENTAFDTKKEEDDPDKRPESLNHASPIVM